MYIYFLFPLHGSLPCHGEAACITQWNYEQCCVGPPKHPRGVGHCGEFWQNSGGGNGKPPQDTCYENLMNYIQGQKDVILKVKPPRSEGVQYAPGEEWRRTTNIPRKNEVAGPKQKWCLVVDMSGDKIKIPCCKQQYCVGTWNVRSTNQGKLELVKQEMVRVNINILAISELKWMGKVKFNSDDLYIYYYGQESHRRNGVAFIIKKRVWNAVHGCSLNNDRMILAYFQGRPFSITVIQICAPTTNAKEAEVDQFYEDLEDFLELTPKKDVLFIIGDWNAK